MVLKEIEDKKELRDLRAHVVLLVVQAKRGRQALLDPRVPLVHLALLGCLVYLEV